MKKLVRIALASAFLASSGFAFAEMGMYGKVNLGFTRRTVPVDF